MLLAILLMVFAMAMAALAVVPSIIQQARRDREEEMIHRGAQYARAIKKFVRKFGRYPMRIEELENTNNLRFLRQRYKDPMTQNGEWHLVHMGEVQLTPAGGGAGSPGSPAGQGRAPGSSTFGPAPQQSQSAFSGPATSGGTLGGGPIIGVSSTSERQSIREFAGKSHYNQWQFIYDPTVDRGGLITGPYQPLQQLMPGAQTPGQQPQQQPTPTLGAPVAR